MKRYNHDPEGMVEDKSFGDWALWADVKYLIQLNEEMLEGLKVAESEIRCQQLEADFNYNRCHGLPTPNIDEMELEGKWCDEVYMLRELIKRVEGEGK
jgi:hypothetical protein